jgi:hypothetical protein
MIIIMFTVSKRKALVVLKAVTIFLGPSLVGNFINSRGNISFSKRVSLHGFSECS